MVIVEVEANHRRIRTHILPLVDLVVADCAEVPVFEAGALYAQVHHPFELLL